MSLLDFLQKLLHVISRHWRSHPPDKASECYVNTLLWIVVFYNHFHADIGIIAGVNEHIISYGRSDLQLPTGDVPDQVSNRFQFFQFCHGIPHMDWPDMVISGSMYIST